MTYNLYNSKVIFQKIEKVIALFIKFTLIEIEDFEFRRLFSKFIES